MNKAADNARITPVAEVTPQPYNVPDQQPASTGGGVRQGLSTVVLIVVVILALAVLAFKIWLVVKLVKFLSKQ